MAELTTGLDLERAVRDIETFSQAASKNREEFYHAFSFLFEELSDLWASPNAKSFGEKFKREITDRLDQYDEDIAIICTNARRAYNILASQQGANTMGDSKWISFLAEDGSYSKGQFVGNMADLLEEKNGRTGMNIEMIRLLLPNFVSKVNSALDSMSSLPSAIAFYDTNGSMQASFNDRISTMKQKIESTISSITTDLQTAMNEEENNLLLAKQQATDTMSA